MEKLGEFGAIYAYVNRLADEDPAIRDAVLNETVKLHSGDPENLRLWNEIRTPVRRRHRANLQAAGR